MDQCIEIWLKYVNSSVDIGNHRYTNEQNCILLKKSVIKKICAMPRKIFLPPPIPESFLLFFVLYLYIFPHISYTCQQFIEKNKTQYFNEIQVLLTFTTLDEI